MLETKKSAKILLAVELPFDFISREEAVWLE